MCSHVWIMYISCREVFSKTDNNSEKNDENLIESLVHCHAVGFWEGRKIRELKGTQLHIDM